MRMLTTQEYRKRAERIVNGHRRALIGLLRHSAVALSEDEIEAVKWAVDSACTGIAWEVAVHELAGILQSNAARMALDELTDGMKGGNAVRRAVSGAGR